MIEYVEPFLSLMSSISINDIKKYLGVDHTKTIDIFGSYNCFLISLNDPQSELYTYVWLCENSYKDVTYKDYKKLGMSIYLVGKIGYIKYIKEYLGFVFKFLQHRTDLNIFTRIYSAFIIGKHRIIRNRFQIEIDKFNKLQVNSINRIHQLFKMNKIDRLYLYNYYKESKLL